MKVYSAGLSQRFIIIALIVAYSAFFTVRRGRRCKSRGRLVSFRDVQTKGWG
jgi:hypothetical protein